MTKSGNYNAEKEGTYRQGGPFTDHGALFISESI
jgi:hypothetical protein